MKRKKIKIKTKNINTPKMIKIKEDAIKSCNNIIKNKRNNKVTLAYINNEIKKVRTKLYTKIK